MNVLKFVFGEQTVTGTKFCSYETLFLAFSGSRPHVTDKTHTLQLSTFRGFPQPSAENEVTRTSPTWLTSSSARASEKYWISTIVVLVVTVASCLN